MDFYRLLLSKNATTPIAAKITPTAIAIRNSEVFSGGGIGDSVGDGEGDGEDVGVGEGVGVGVGVGTRSCLPVHRTSKTRGPAA